MPSTLLKCLATLFAFACSSGGEWLAKVGDQPIGVEAYQQRLRAAQKDLGDIPVLDRQGMLLFQQRLLAEMVAEQLLLAEADRRGIALSDEEVAAEVASLRQDANDREWQSYLLEHYIDERAWQQQLRMRLRIERLLRDEVAANKPVQDADIAAHFAEITRDAEPSSEIELSQIVVADPKTAQELRREIQAGAAFADVARRHSIGPEKDKGGYLGFVRAIDLPHSFAPAFELNAGQLSGVVETEFGFHLFWNHAVRQNSVPTLAARREQIRQILLRERIEATRGELLAKLKAQTPIELNQKAWSKLLGE